MAQMPEGKEMSQKRALVGRVCQGWGCLDNPPREECNAAFWAHPRVPPGCSVPFASRCHHPDDYDAGTLRIIHFFPSCWTGRREVRTKGGDSGGCRGVEGPEF